MPTTTKKPTVMKPPRGATCVECVMGSSFYLPCGKPATAVVTFINDVRGNTFTGHPMCPTCANHNTKNRGGKLAITNQKVEFITAADIQKSLKQGEPAIAKAPAAALPVADVEDGGEEGPTATQLSVVTKNVSRALRLQEVIIPEAEGVLAKLQEELKALNEVTIPNAMLEAKMAGYTYMDRNDGKWQVGLVEDIKASVKKANLPAFISYLAERKEDDLVKRKVVIKFGRDQIKLALKFIADLRKRKVDLNPTIEEEINWQTLNAYVRERRQAAINEQRDPDKELPPQVDLFKIRVVKYEQVDAKKGVAEFDN